MRPPTIRYILFGSIAASFALYLQGRADEPSDSSQPDLTARIEALESQSQADRATISEQSKLIAALQSELKTAKAIAAQATADAKAELSATILANRKEVYIDIGTIFNRTSYPDPGMADIGRAHEHGRNAVKTGYLVGIRDGERSAVAAGSYRMMPKVLQDKCDRIKAQ